MSRRVPPDAFARFLAMGPARTISALAALLGVSRRTVTRKATEEDWKRRIEDHERQLRETAEQKASESLEKLNEKHQKMLNLIAAKSIEALRSMPLDSALAAVKSLEVVIRTERLIRGAPTDRNSLSIEERVREESQRWLKEPMAAASAAR